MLYWKANFQIPNAGVQSAEVFVITEVSEDGILTAKSYADRELKFHLFDKEYNYSGDDPYGYLLSQPEFLTYEII